MNLRAIRCPTAIAVLTALAISIPLVAQTQFRAGQSKEGRHHRYKLIDVSTLGGPQSFSYFGDAQSLNNNGVVVGQADTRTPAI